MKILFVATVDIHIINHHLRIIHKLKELGHQVDVAANGDFINADITKKYNVCFSKNPFSLDNVKAQKEICTIVEKGQYDIVSCHTPLSSYFTRMAIKDLPCKVMYMAHGFHFYKGAPIVNQTIYKTMEKRAARYTDVLVTINQEDYMAATTFSLRKGGEVKLIPGVGIDEASILNQMVSKDRVKAELGFATEDTILMSVGELNKNKNHLFVLHALKDMFVENPNLHYIICGIGPYKERIEKWVQTNQLSKQIHLLGYREDVRHLLYGADIFLSPSFREGLPVSVLEAMVVGVPVIASDVRGNHDLIEHGKTGYVYPVEDARVFHNQVQTLLEDTSLQNKFIENAKAAAHQYAIESIDPMILALYTPK